MHPLRKLGALLIENGKPYNTFGTFRGPFNVGHTYVNDASGTTVADCPSKEVAKVICDLLNEKFQRPKKVSSVIKPDQRQP
jgi:hypothetical protein